MLRIACRTPRSARTSSADEVRNQTASENLRRGLRHEECKTHRRQEVHRMRWFDDSARYSYPYRFWLFVGRVSSRITSKNSQKRSRLTDSAPTEDLCGIGRSFLSSPRAEHLQEAYLARKILGLLPVGHLTHLECDVLEPVLYRLHPRNHCRQLGSDDRLTEERFAEYFTLMSPSVIIRVRIEHNWMLTHNALETFL